MNNQTNPNKIMARSLQEFVNVAAAPLTGQTRNLQFCCRDMAHFHEVAAHLTQELIESGVFKSQKEFRFVAHPGADGCLVTGELEPTLNPEEWKYPESEIELSQRYTAAYRYVAAGANPGF